MIRLAIQTAAGQTEFSAERTELLIGRREGVDLRLNDPATSRNHCLLRVEGDRVRVVDLGSNSGVRINGSKVDEALLGPGERFRIGNTHLTLVGYTGAPAISGLRLEEPTAAAGPTARVPAPRPAVSRLHPTSDFGSEIRTMVTRSPWYTISLVVHLVALLAVHLLTDTVTRRVEPRTIVAETNLEIPELEEALSARVAEPDLADLAPEEPMEEEFLMPDEPRGDDQAENEAFKPKTVQEYSPVIGTRKSLSTRLSQPLTLPSVSKESGETINRGDIDGEQRGAKQAVERGVGGGLSSLRRIRKDRIVVVRGDFDQMEKILEIYDIPHTTISRDQLRSRNFPAMQLLCINCDQQPPPSQRKALVDKARKFVRDGGWLTTSDWSVDPYLTNGFPRKVLRVISKKRNQPDTTIEVRQQTTSPLLEGVLARRTLTKWWLEDASFMVKVDERLVQVLIVSDDMKARFGGHAVAFTWHEDKGRVLHLLGHFYQKDGNKQGLVAMHRLIVNFLMERFPSR